MPRRIQSFKIGTLEGERTIRMPAHAEVIDGVVMTKSGPVILAHVGDGPDEQRDFLVIAVGHELPNGTLGWVGVFESRGRLYAVLEMHDHF